MFVDAEVEPKVGFTQAQARLTGLTRAGWLLSASRGAYGEGISSLAQSGPPGSVPGMFRLVRVHFRDLVARSDSANLALRWEVIGPGGQLFPALDADISLSPAGEHATAVTLAGVYRPPPGSPSNGLDQVIWRRIAIATVRAFLGRLARALAVPAQVA